MASVCPRPQARDRRAEDPIERLSLPREKIELFRLSEPSAAGDAAQPAENALNAMPDRDDGKSAATRELGPRDAFEFELGQELAFFGGKPSTALAAVKKLLEQDVGMRVLYACFGLKESSVSPVRFILQRLPRFANGPTKSVAAYFSRDGKGDVRVARLKVLGAKKFKKRRKKTLGRVIAGE